MMMISGVMMIRGLEECLRSEIALRLYSSRDYYRPTDGDLVKEIRKQVCSEAGCEDAEKVD
jgi:hypothetical protein